MRILVTIAAGLALASAPAFAATPKKASAKPAAAASSKKPPAEVEHAMLYLKVLISGLQSDKVEQPIKGAIVGCLYNNTLGKITESMDKVIAENPGKISREDPNQVLAALVQICGFEPGSAGTPPAPVAKPAGR